MFLAIICRNTFNNIQIFTDTLRIRKNVIVRVQILHNYTYNIEDLLQNYKIMLTSLLKNILSANGLFLKEIDFTRSITVIVGSVLVSTVIVEAIKPRSVFLQGI